MKATLRLGGLVLATACSVALVGCSASHGPGKMAPDFKLDSLAGQTVTLSQYKGNVVLLGFWAVG